MQFQGVDRQHIDGVARASSAGTKSGSSARSLVLLTMLASVSRTARLGHGWGRKEYKRTVNVKYGVRRLRL